jgi:hypothetical protein
MKEATSGNSLPVQTYTWPIANQAIAAGAAFQPAALVLNSVAVGNGIPHVRARAALPATAAGSAPTVEAWISAANAVTLRISNQSAAALVATAADIIFDVMVLPIRP